MEQYSDLTNIRNLDHLFGILKENKVVFEKGLSDEELHAAEQKFRFTFPPDLKAFLKYGLPVGIKGTAESKFPNWRNLNDPFIRSRMEWSLEGILYDIENNGFWLDRLGPKPENLQDAFKIMTEAFNLGPKLIPIWGHRFLPDTPNEANNPVLSVYQTDIIYYGANLYDYFQTELNNRKHLSTGAEIKPIKFWKEIVDSNV